jgi:Sulfotransferase family
VLYHMLLSAGDFAVYRAESNVFNLLVPRFGGMRSEADRRELLDVWLRSKLFRVSGLEAGEIRGKILAQCRGGGDFLRIVMEEIAQKQGVRRWADCTPDHLLSMEEIKRDIPEALFIHIIRDGRDVALSYVQQKWSHPLPWDRDDGLAVAALYWEWVVREGRAQGARLGADYREVRFEELITNPRQTLAELSSFIDHDLDYDKIQEAGIGSVSRPNSSFSGEASENFNPVARWKIKMSAEEIARLEQIIGDLLLELGYGLGAGNRLSRDLRARRLRATYLPMFEAKNWMKKTPLGRLVGLNLLEVESASAG